MKTRKTPANKPRRNQEPRVSSAHAVPRPLRITIVSPMGEALYRGPSKGKQESRIPFGGAEVQLRMLAREFRAAGHSVTVIVAGEHPGRHTTLEGITVVTAYQLRKYFGSHARAGWQLLRAIQHSKPDVIIQRNAGPETAMCALAARIIGAKFVYSVSHDIDVSGEYASRGVLGKLYAKGFLHADAIVLQSSEQKRLLQTWKPSHRKPNRIIPSAYPEHVPRVRKNNSVLWVARSDRWKRPEAFLAAARAIPTAHFVMIMPQSSDTETFNNTTREAKHIPNLTVLPAVPFEAIQLYFDRASIFVNTSVAEGFPNTYIQACLAGTPIVALTVDPDAILSQRGCGIVCNNSQTKLVDALKTLLANPTLRKRIASTQREYVQARHSTAACRSAWLAVIREALGDSTGNASGASGREVPDLPSPKARVKATRVPKRRSA